MCGGRSLRSNLSKRNQCKVSTTINPTQKPQNTGDLCGQPGGRGSGKFQGNCGYGHGRGGRGWGNKHTMPNMKCQRDDSTYEGLLDGTYIELHMSSYADTVWGMIPYPARKRLMDQQAAYKATTQRTAQQVSRQSSEDMSQLTHQQTDEGSQTPHQRP